MKTTSYYPIIQVRDVQASAKFYVDNLEIRRLVRHGLVCASAVER